MNAVLREYLAKGVFLGLWAYLALIQPDWATFTRIVIWGVVGFVLGYVAGFTQQILRGYKPTANLPGFLLLVLLDSPYFIYIGLIGGIGLGIGLETDPPDGREWLGYCGLGGALLGFGLFQLRQVRDWFWRFGLGIVVGGILTYLVIHYIDMVPALSGNAAQRQFGIYLLIGLPFFYLLTFCGEAEESEVEIAAICAAGGIGLFSLKLESGLPDYGDKIIFLVPLLAYFIYSTKWLPGLRIFKHNLRGYGYLSLKRYRESLLCFSRALQLDRRNKLAADGLWQLMRKVDVSKLDDDTTKLLPVEFCLSMASDALIGGRTPTDAEREEAVRMLDVVQKQRPAAQPQIDYLRAIAQTHAKDFDGAAETLSRLLNPETNYTGDARKTVLFTAWDLALRLHPELVKRLGVNELAKPGRRIEAIGAVERQLVQQPDDAVAAELKRELYSTLTEAEFIGASATTSPTDFNYDYVEQLGLALIGESDPEQVDRGMAYLRIAARGLPVRGPMIFKQLADVATKLGRTEEATGYFGQIKRVGIQVGPTKLPADQLALYIATLKKLSDDAVVRQDYPSAIEDMRLYVEAGKEDANTLRHLAELYAKHGDPLNALLIAERGLLYAKTDVDLLQKKDSYYFSVDIERVRAVKDKVAPWFDVDYCIRKSRAVCDQKELDLDTLEWGLHLARLARVIKPDSHAAMLAEARLLLRKGERDNGLSLLEDIREQKRGSGDEEDAWFIATRILGEMYLDELDRPDLAIPCFSDYREYQRSGADTLYQLGRAHEANKNIPAAIKSYELVTAYQSHPRFYDATEAVRRLKG